MATIMYEGPAHAGHGGQTNGGIWWTWSEKYKVTAMFSAPTVRVLKKAGPGAAQKSIT
jgi:acyl-coenzyme A synthetase/AMP-(fatty) acid ligase